MTLNAIDDAQARLAAGDFDGAAIAAAALLAREPDHAAALDVMYETSFARGRFAEAVGHFRAAARKHPGDATLAYKLGCMLEAEGNHESALAEYAEALRIDPRFAKAHNNRGATLQKLGRVAEALQCFDRALEIDPGLWQAHYNTGNVHKLAGRLGDAVAPFQHAMRLRRAVGGGAAHEPAQTFGGTTRSKLNHDAEQLRYLIDRKLISAEHSAAIAALERAERILAPQFESNAAVAFPAELQGAAAPIYNRLLHFYDAPSLAGPAVNPNLDRRAIEDAYFRTGPGITYVDDFLTPRALDELRRFCLESTMWFDYLYDTGYVGASLEEGFACPLLAQIAAELPLALPRIFPDRRLTQMWAYKYDSERSGIAEHADFADVNVNFWLTPDDANLDPQRGGLVVWDKEAPSEWDFDEFNRDQQRIQQFLGSSGARPVTIPYRQNRVVIFNSDLFHKTDAYRFRPGYLNRRINVTFLYGYRQAGDDPLKDATGRA